MASNYPRMNLSRTRGFSGPPDGAQDSCFQVSKYLGKPACGQSNGVLPGSSSTFDRTFSTIRISQWSSSRY